MKHEPIKSTSAQSVCAADDAKAPNAVYIYVLANLMILRQTAV